MSVEGVLPTPRAGAQTTLTWQDLKTAKDRLCTSYYSYVFRMKVFIVVILPLFHHCILWTCWGEVSFGFIVPQIKMGLIWTLC